MFIDSKNSMKVNCCKLAAAELKPWYAGIEKLHSLSPKPAVFLTCDPVTLRGPQGFQGSNEKA